MDESSTELILHLVIYGNNGPYIPHNFKISPKAPKFIPKWQVGRYMVNYSKHSGEKRRLVDAVRELLPSDFEPLLGPIGLEIQHWRQGPKGRRWEEGDWVVTRPDESNLDKLIEDALTGLVYKDDNQVCCRPGQDFKRYSKEPRVEIFVYRML